MATAKSVDEYIDNLPRKSLIEVIFIFLMLSTITIGASYELTKKGWPVFIFLTVGIPIGYLIWELSRRRKKLGERIWSILCPECDEYIPLHQFVCEPPCEHEYTDRSIIEGCPVCKSRYKKKGHDAFRRAICDNCGYELEFSEPYDFKPWSVLAKGQTWETETILVKHVTLFSLLEIPMGLIGTILIIAGYNEIFLLKSTNDLALFGGIYFFSMGLIFWPMQKFLYGDIHRIPNPTFKRKAEPEEIYVFKDSLERVLLFDIVTPLLFLGSIALIYAMLIKMYLRPYNPYMEELTRYTYTPFEVAWRLIPLAVTLGLIIYRSTSYPEYKKVPNPGYKEESS